MYKRQLLNEPGAEASDSAENELSDAQDVYKRQEVTVASHEFEKNLEQNQESEKQQGERQQEQSGGRRRNLNLSSLDGLSGLMTEERCV